MALSSPGLSPAQVIRFRRGSARTRCCRLDSIWIARPPALCGSPSVPHWIEIGGKVLDASGGPVSGALLAVASDGSAGQDTAAAGANGAFRLMLRQPGDYHIHLMDDPSDWDDPDYVKKHESDFPLLRVVDGTTAPVTLRLPAQHGPA